MKRIFITLLFILYQLSTVTAQNIQLRSNGFISEFRQIDTLHYTEYRLEGKTVANLKKQDPSTLVLRQSFGRTSNKSPEASEEIFYTTKYFVYTDGTLQAPTSQIFFKPVEIDKFKKEVKNIGTIEVHPFLERYYFLNVTNKNWLSGEKIFTLCNNLYESKIAEVIEPVFVKQIKVDNPLRPWQWNIRNNANIPGGIIGADMAVENAWNMGVTGAGIRVAIIDDGVDLTHPDLVNNLLPGFDATGNNSGGAPANNNGHGTNIAGIIAATDNADGVIGVAFNANIIPIRKGIVVDGFFVNVTETMTATCFNEAVNRGADVISCSWGGGSPSTQINAAIQNAVNNGRGGRGCIVLFASGNRNRNIDYPSSNPQVIAVGASSSCDTRKRSSNNPALVNRGVSTDPEGASCDGELWWGSNFGTGLDVLAPGVWISTTDNVGANGYVDGNFNNRFNGTSAACPNVAAVVALILSANPNLTGIQARNILEQTCFKIPNGNFQPNIPNQPNGTWSNQAGYGRIDAGAAVCMALITIMTINGPSIVCTGGNFTLQNQPAGTTVIWSSSNPNGLTIDPSTGAATRVNNFNGQITVTATVNSGCGVANVTRDVWVGYPPANMNTLIWTGTRGVNPVSTSPGATYIFNVDQVPNTSSYTWVLPRGFSVLYGGSNTTTGPSIYITTSTTSGTYILHCAANNACGSSWTNALTINNETGGGGGPIPLIVYPNPASSILIIEEATTDSESLLGQSRGKDETAEFNVQLFDYHGSLRKSGQSKNRKLEVNTDDLPDGFYILKIMTPLGTEHRHISIKH